MARSEQTFLYRSARYLGWFTLVSVIAIAGSLWFNRPPDCLEPSESLVGMPTYEAPPCMFIRPFSLYQATLETSIGKIDIVLAPEISPVAVNSFIFLAIHGWYDGNTFHRIEITEDHSFAQAGAANTDGTGTAGFLVQHDVPSPILRYVEGAVVGVVSGDPLRFGSQFFIVGKEWQSIQQPAQDPIYPPLGRIYDLASLNVARQLFDFGSEDGAPSAPIIIKSVSVVRLNEQEEQVPILPGDARR